MTTPNTDAAQTFATRILTELRDLRTDLDRVGTEVSILREVASRLFTPAVPTEDSPIQAMMRLLGLLVGGTEETHKRLESLSAMLVDPRITAALRSAILEH